MQTSEEGPGESIRDTASPALPQESLRRDFRDESESSVSGDSEALLSNVPAPLQGGQETVLTRTLPPVTQKHPVVSRTNSPQQGEETRPSGTGPHKKPAPAQPTPAQQHQFSMELCRCKNLEENPESQEISREAVEGCGLPGHHHYLSPKHIILLPRDPARPSLDKASTAGANSLHGSHGTADIWFMLGPHHSTATLNRKVRKPFYLAPQT